MLLLLRDGALRGRLGAQGIERARRHFTWSTVVDRFEALFLELVGTRMRGRSHVNGRARIARPARAQSDAPARALGIGS
jgi:hypothetical protein